MSNERKWSDPNAMWLDGAEKEREQCCKDICWLCRKGSTPRRNADRDGLWWHKMEWCEAAHIRERAWQESENLKFADNPADKTNC